MDFHLSGGTGLQRLLVTQAIARCAYPLDAIEASVTVQWGAVPPNDIMFTQANTDFTFTITIAPWADDPSAPENQGLIDPVAEVQLVYMEDFVHEIGHVVSGVSFISQNIAAMCELFTRQSGGGSVQGGLADFDNSGPWALLIKEAVAECFKCGFYTGKPLIFGNRTQWDISEANWSKFLTLLEPVGEITGVAWSYADQSNTVPFTNPMSIKGRPAKSSAAIGGRIGITLCGTPSAPDGYLQETLAQVGGLQQQPDGTWVSTFYVIDELFSEGSVTTCPATVEYDPSNVVQFPGFAVPLAMGGHISATDEGIVGASELFWRYVITLGVTIPSTGDFLNASFEIGYNLHSPFTAVRGVDVFTHIDGVDAHTVFTQFIGFSEEFSDAIDFNLQLVSVPVPISAPYPFIPLVIGSAVPGPAATGLQLVERG